VFVEVGLEAAIL